MVGRESVIDRALRTAPGSVWRDVAVTRAIKTSAAGC